MKVRKGVFGGKKLGDKVEDWCKLGIEWKVEEMGDYGGMGIGRVSGKKSWGVGFDGCGFVVGKNKKDVGRFKNGKRYECDLRGW